MVEGALIPREPYCVVVGGINLDIQGFSNARYVAGDSNPGSVRRAIGGVGRNIAENLVRLGVRAELITVLGDGPEWDILIRNSIDAGIGLSHSPRFHSIDLPTYLCVLEPDGRLAGAVADMGAIDRLHVEHLESRRELFDAASAIVVDGNVPRECIEWIAAHYGARPREPDRGANPGTRAEILSRNEGPLLIADPVSGAKARKFMSCFGQFDIAKPNAAEAAIIAGLPPDADLGATIASLAAHSNLPSELYISLGERGIAVARGTSLKKIALCPASHRPSTVNRSGAGDAACATLVWLSVAARPSDALASSLLASTPREKAQFAIAGALFAAAAEAPVNPRLSVENLCETARTCYPELAPLIEIIRNGGNA